MAKQTPKARGERTKARIEKLLEKLDTGLMVLVGRWELMEDVHSDAKDLANDALELMTLIHEWETRC